VIWKQTIILAVNAVSFSLIIIIIRQLFYTRYFYICTYYVRATRSACLKVIIWIRETFSPTKRYLRAIEWRLPPFGPCRWWPRWCRRRRRGSCKRWARSYARFRPTQSRWTTLESDYELNKQFKINFSKWLSHSNLSKRSLRSFIPLHVGLKTQWFWKGGFVKATFFFWKVIPGMSWYFQII